MSIAMGANRARELAAYHGRAEVLWWTTPSNHAQARDEKYQQLQAI